MDVIPFERYFLAFSLYGVDFNVYISPRPTKKVNQRWYLIHEEVFVSFSIILNILSPKASGINFLPA
jgi:hypothetical protein